MKTILIGVGAIAVSAVTAVVGLSLVCRYDEQIHQGIDRLVASLRTYTEPAAKYFAGLTAKRKATRPSSAFVDGRV